MQIVVFDSDRETSSAIRRTLAAEGHDVSVLADGPPPGSCDLVVLDAAAWSERAIAELAARVPSAQQLLLVDSVDARLPAESAMSLVKPLDATKLVRLVRAIEQSRRGQSDPRDLVDFETLFSGDSPAIVELLRQVRLLSQSDAPVWLHGELGSGRAVVARAIHDGSLRQRRMFLAVNAVSFPGDLLEEHLFVGDEPLIQRADGGTLFIDSVTELAPGVQAKLLRLVEERRLRLRGVDHPLDVRVMVGDERRSLNVGGRLRRELYHRLKVHEIDLPPLRARARDLGAIITRMLDRLRSDGRPLLLSSAATRALEAYPFPGNIRELAHALTHATVLSQGGQIEIQHLPIELQPPSAPPPKPDDGVDPASLESLDAVVKRVERDYLLRVLRAVGGNRTRAAKILSLSRKGLWQKLKAHGIPAGEGRGDGDDDLEIG
jgi:DNA-binding NtrC family response regulator